MKKNTSIAKSVLAGVKDAKMADDEVPNYSPELDSPDCSAGKLKDADIPQRVSRPTIQEPGKLESI